MERRQHTPPTRRWRWTRPAIYARHDSRRSGRKLDYLLHMRYAAPSMKPSALSVIRGLQICHTRWFPTPARVTFFTMASFVQQKRDLVVVDLALILGGGWFANVVSTRPACQRGMANLHTRNMTVRMQRPSR